MRAADAERRRPRLAGHDPAQHRRGWPPGRSGQPNEPPPGSRLENALADGAVGLSSGLDYLPSRFGSSSEVAGMARPLAAAGRPYVSHLRGYGAEVRAGLAELVAVGRGAGIRVHASHLWGTPADIEAAFGPAEAAGVAVTFDMYSVPRSPARSWPCSCSRPRCRPAVPTAHLAALADPAQRAVLLAGEKLTEDYLRNVYLGCLPPAAARVAGLSVAEAAARSARSRPGSGCSTCWPTRAGRGRAPGPAGAQRGDMAWLAVDDRHCAGSDGIYQGQHPTRGDTARSPGWPGTTWPTGPRPDTSAWPGTWPRTPPTSTACANRGRLARAWRPTSA